MFMQDIRFAIRSLRKGFLVTAFAILRTEGQARAVAEPLRMALFLASLGTYGVLAYTVGQRTKEIGVRMAIGAEAKDVVGMVSREGVKMALIGLGIGTVLLIPLTMVIGNLLQGLSDISELTMVFVGLVLFAVTLAASVLPARRAALVDPVCALRQE